MVGVRVLPVGPRAVLLEVADVAAALFAEHGYDAATVRAIATRRQRAERDEVGVGPSSGVRPQFYTRELNRKKTYI